MVLRLMTGLPAVLLIRLWLAGFGLGDASGIWRQGLSCLPAGGADGATGPATATHCLSQFPLSPCRLGTFSVLCAPLGTTQAPRARCPASGTRLAATASACSTTWPLLQHTL